MAGVEFRHHLGLKAVSIGLAFLLWLVVSGEETVERAFSIPLEFANLPAGLEMGGEPPSAIDVRLRGSSGLVGRTNPAELSAVIDLRDSRPGRRFFSLQGEQVRTPFGLDVVQITPSTLTVTLEPSTVKLVPIVPGVEGEPAMGFVVGRVTADPAVVELVGPADAIAGVAEATTEPISVAGASADLSEQVTVGPPSSLVRLRNPTRTRVHVAIARTQGEWTIAKVPVKVIGAQGERWLNETVTVRVRGLAGGRQVGPADFDASVDVVGLRPGDATVPVRVVAPEEIAVIQIEPAQLVVRVR